MRAERVVAWRDAVHLERTSGVAAHRTDARLAQACLRPEQLNRHVRHRAASRIENHTADRAKLRPLDTMSTGPVLFTGTYAHPRRLGRHHRGRVVRRRKRSHAARDRPGPSPVWRNSAPEAGRFRGRDTEDPEYAAVVGAISCNCDMTRRLPQPVAGDTARPSRPSRAITAARSRRPRGR